MKNSILFQDTNQICKSFGVIATYCIKGIFKARAKNWKIKRQTYCLPKTHFRRKAKVIACLFVAGIPLHPVTTSRNRFMREKLPVRSLKAAECRFPRYFTFVVVQLLTWYLTVFSHVFFLFQHAAATKSILSLHSLEKWYIRSRLIQTSRKQEVFPLSAENFYSHS